MLSFYPSVSFLQIYRKIILPFVVHGYDIWTPVLRSEPTMTISKIKLVGGYLGIKRR
jgi:hypothetical protein